MFSKLQLTNFTVFEHLDLTFSPKINVFVGANGTGKTHILKLLYCFLALRTRSDRSAPVDLYLRKLVDIFNPAQSQLGHLVRRQIDGDQSTIISTWNGHQAEVTLNRENQGTGKMDIWPLTFPPPVFIPSKEPLSFAPGFISLYDLYGLSFEEVFYDLLKLAYLPHYNKVSSENQNILDRLFEIIGGEEVVIGETFYLRHKKHDTEISLVAEGIRKLALLWQLIRNGAIQKGNTLFWDEPEANLNPIMMQYVARSLIMLANNGVQIFLATHNYSFLRELDYQKEKTEINHFALDDAGDNGVEAHVCADYINISPNKIAEENIRIYDMEIKRSLGGYT